MISSAPHALRIYPVVMAGGSGTRFWPLSRRDRPKQFIPIGGQKTLFEETMERLDALAPWSQRYVVAGEGHADTIRQRCPELPESQLLIEPCARNTAPCVALATHHIAQRDPHGLIIVLPADHYIQDVEAFQSALRSAVNGAAEGKIVTLGVIPTRPETGYGYIQYQGRGDPNQSRLPVDRFVEKPPRRVAEEYLASGDYLWNSGVFIFSAQRMLNEIHQQLPALDHAFEPVRDALERADLPQYSAALDHAFSQIRPISIDVGVMEGASQVEVIPLQAGWSDVGHWAAIEEISMVDEQSNILIGHPDHVSIDSTRVTIHSDRLTAVVGLKDIVVVNTVDATLVCHRDHAQSVRDVVEMLKKRGRGELT